MNLDKLQGPVGDIMNYYSYRNVVSLPELLPEIIYFAACPPDKKRDLCKDGFSSKAEKWFSGLNGGEYPIVENLKLRYDNKITIR